MLDYMIFQNGKRNALTMSYDDGFIADRRLAEIFNRYGIKATFHLNSGRFNCDGSACDADFATTYKNHEVSVHTVDHPYPDRLPDRELIHQVLCDKQAIETRCGYPVRGMSYPYGVYNDHVIGVLRDCGMCYSRTVKATEGFGLPEDFMQWHPTCHHKDAMKCADNFFTRKHCSNLFYVWGHSFELERGNTWDAMEEFCKRMSGLEDVWYATNIEIYDYVTAQRGLQISADESMIYNPAAIDVWVKKDGRPVKIPGGQLIRL